MDSLSGIVNYSQGCSILERLPSPFGHISGRWTGRASQKVWSYRSTGWHPTVSFKRRDQKTGYFINFSKVEHPSYDSWRTGHDISLLRLHQGVNMNNFPNINSACWPTRTPAVGSQVMASGWGQTFQNFGILEQPKLLQKVLKLKPVKSINNFMGFFLLSS